MNINTVVFRLILVVLAGFSPCFAFTGEAGVNLPVLISDGMVIQRDKPATIWGWADGGETVTVRLMGNVYTTTTGEDGRWQVELPAMPAGGPYVMNINEHEINDILVGDVWLCSGQSNMELPVSRVLDMFRDEVERDSNPMIRHLHVRQAYDFHALAEDIEPASWKSLTPENAIGFSAVAYFFAKAIYAETGVPVGMINSSIGGSPAEAWISADSLERYPRYYNELQMCRNDEYVELTKSMDQMNSQVWHDVLNVADKGYALGWETSGFDDSGWKTIDLFDRSWGSDRGNPVNGSFWFRKTVNIPPEYAGKEAILRMGYIIDADHTYVNGTLVGHTGYQYPPRIYKIPEGVLKAGKNVIAVRLLSQSWYPGFIHDKPYKIVFDDEEISLEGEWKMHPGARMPQAAGQTFFNWKPAGLYNGMIAPLANMNIKGVLWYQGEANTGRPNDYYDLMKTLIANWRADFGDTQLPFLIVQLVNFMEPDSYPGDGAWPQLRDVQLRLSQTVPYTGLAVGIDAGEWNDIHPLDKKTIAERLALQARRVAYGENIVSDGPVYESIKVENGRAVLSFREGTNDLEPADKLTGFAIAGEDGRFHWAEARTDGKTVVVWSDNVPDPMYVRYAWGNNPEGANLRNWAGLPASPFRTDK